MSKGGSTKMATSTSSIPKKYEPFVDNVLAAAGTLANRPYEEYLGPTIAGFSPDQVAGFDMVRNLGDQVNPMMNAAINANTAGLNSITDPSTMMDLYQNRFTDDVIDNLTADLQEERDMMNATARLRTPYGGSRSALIEAENNKNYLDTLGSKIGQLRMQNFNDSARLGQSATGQLMAGANQTMNQAGAAQNMGLNQAGALSGIGQQVQGINQAAMQDSESRFLDRVNYPIQNLSMLQSAIGATPMGTVSRVPISKPSGLGGLLSGGGALLQGLGAIGVGVCWVAREVYGTETQTWKTVRDYVINKAPMELLAKYISVGPEVAEKIKKSPELKAKYKTALDRIVEIA